jgi:Cu2+-exporting ATPase
VRGRSITTRCAHCGLDAGPSPRESSGRLFCCAGCEAVYAILHEEGLGVFYEGGGLGSLTPRQRASDDGRAPPPALPNLAPLEAAGTATLDLVGMRCASCAWLIERYLGHRAGVSDVRASYATATCTLRWDPARTSLASLLGALERIGYRGRPSDPLLRTRQGEGEQRVLLVRMGLSLFLAMNVMLASLGLYAGEVQGMAEGTRTLLRGVACLLAMPVVFWGGWPFLRGAVSALRARRATMDTLIALGSLTALTASVAGLVTGGHVYFDTAAMIVALILVGRVVEQGARRRGMRAIRGLLELSPATARLASAGSGAVIEAADLVVGQEVEVRPGERYPCDGTVLDGRSETDESLLTGEARPRAVGIGNIVHGGALNAWGVLRVRADRVGADTAVRCIALAVERAMASRAPVERLADRVVGVFVPAVLALAAVAAIGWWIGTADLARATMTAVAVVVIACPCALGLATPATLVVALGEAARRGIFFRDAAALERAADVRLVAFDKTGTLTDGRLIIQDVRPAAGWGGADVLRLAAAAEQSSEHTLGRAIVAAARAQGTPIPAAGDFRSTPGGGVAASVEGRRVVVGGPAFVRAHGVEAEDEEPDATLALVAVDGKLAGSLLAGDAVRPEARLAVARLSDQRIGSALVSGDLAGPVFRAAGEAGISPSDAHPRLTPEGKAALITSWRDGGLAVAMVGDGVNDAPALAAATLGIAVGTGTDVALETADVALSGAGVAAVPLLFAIARRARRIVRQNLAWAMGYNLAAVPLAMAGVVHPALAAAAMALSSVSVLLNALRAGQTKAPGIAAEGYRIRSDGDC